MTVTPGSELAVGVQSRCVRRRVAIAVNPKLLGDALSRALAKDELEIVVLGEEPGAGGSRHADVLIVSHEPPEDVDAEVVIHLPDDNSGGIGLVTTPESSERVAMGDLASVTAAVDRYSGVADP